MHDVEVVKFDSEMRRIADAAAIPRRDDRAETPTKPIRRAETKPTRRREKIDWKKELEPQGAETRIGQAVRQIVNDERGAPVSAIVVFSDGGQNAGVDIAAAIKAAQEAQDSHLHHRHRFGQPRRRTCASAIWSPRRGRIPAIAFK